MSDLNRVGNKKAVRFKCVVRFPIGLVEERYVRALNEQNAKHLLSHAIGVRMGDITVVGQVGEP